MPLEEGLTRTSIQLHRWGHTYLGNIARLDRIEHRAGDPASFVQLIDVVNPAMVLAEMHNIVGSCLPNTFAAHQLSSRGSIQVTLSAVLAASGDYSFIKAAPD